MWNCALRILAFSSLGGCFLVTDISGEDTKKLVEAGAILVDVRTPEEFAEAHIAGALNIPVGQINERAEELGPKDRPVVVYCASGLRSLGAKRDLQALGFREVYNLGAMSRWD